MSADGPGAQERTRQQRDPVGTTVVRMFTCTVVAGAVGAAVVSSLLMRGEIVSPALAAFALALSVTAVVLVFVQTSPYRPPVSRHTYLLVLVLAVLAYFLYIAATFGNNRFGRDDWGPPVLGVLLIAFGPYRPAREIAVTGAAVACLIGLGTVVQARWFATIAPTDAFVVVSVTPLIALCFGAVAYSSGMVSAIERWQRRAGAEVRDGARVSQGIARSVQQDRVTILGRDVLPFFTDVVAAGSITEADRERAREIAVSVRDVMVAEADRSWLESAVLVTGTIRPESESAVIDDPRRLAAGMSTAQRMAVRTLLGAFASEPGFDPNELRIELSRDGDLCVAAISARFTAETSSPRAALAPYFALLRSVFDDFDVTFAAPSLRMGFHYEHH